MRALLFIAEDGTFADVTVKVLCGFTMHRKSVQLSLMVFELFLWLGYGICATKSVTSIFQSELVESVYFVTKEYYFRKELTVQP